MREVAKEALAHGLFDEADRLLPEHTGETQAKLASAFMDSTLKWSELNALALAVRALGDLEPFEPALPLTTRQKAALTALTREAGIPDPLRGVLESAAPSIKKRRDLYALYGVLSGTMDDLISKASVMKLAESDAVRTRRRKTHGSR